PSRPLIRRSRRRHRRAVHPLDLSHLDFRGRRCGGAVVIEASGVGPGDVMVVQAADDDLLLPAERSTDLNFVTGPNGTVRFRGLAVYRNLPAPARFLRFGPRAK